MTQDHDDKGKAAGLDESAQSSEAQVAAREPEVDGLSQVLGWATPAQKISWNEVALAAPPDRKRRISLGTVGQLIFKSGDEARKCRLEKTPGKKGAQGSSLTVELAPEGQKAARLLLPLSILSILDGLPRGASATFSLTLQLTGSEQAKPLDWIALLGRGPDDNLYFWRKIAEKVDLRSPELHSWRFSAVVSREEMPREILLAMELRPSAGAVTFGEIKVALEAVATEAGTLDVRPKAGAIGQFKSTDGGGDAWLHAFVGATPLVRLKIGRTTDLFKIKREGDAVRFSLSADALARTLGGRNHAWRLVLTDHGTAVAQATVGSGLLEVAADRQAGPEDVGGMEDKALARMLRRLRNVDVLSRARSHFMAKNWAGALTFHKVLVGESKEYQKLVAMVGRAALYANETQVALRLLGAGVAAFPEDGKMQYYYGLAHTHIGKYREALPYFREALRLAPSDMRANKALASALRRAARDTLVASERIVMLGEAAVLLSGALDLEYTYGTATALVELLTELARHDEALRLIDRLLDDGQRDATILLLKVRNLTSLNRVAEALPLADEVSSMDPDNPAARFHRRTLQFLGAGVQAVREPVLGDVIRLPTGGLLIGPLGEAGWPLTPRPTDSSELAIALARLPFDWLRLMDTRNIQTAPEGLAAAVDATAGFCEFGKADAEPTRLWRREALVQLAESGLVRPDLSDLGAFEAVYRRSKPDAPELSSVVIVSRQGHVQGDGGDRFVQSMAEHYRSLGYVPVIVGTQPELTGNVGEGDGFSFAFVDQSAASLRQAILQSRARLVHVLSGVGLEVSEALSYTNIPFIYGIHLEGDALGDDSEGYLDGKGRRISAADFQRILSRSESVYANSESTQSILERAFGVRCPVIQSVPRDGEAPWGLT